MKTDAADVKEGQGFKTTAEIVDMFRLFNQSPGRYSRWNQRTGARERNVGWRLDYFFVNQGFVKQVRHSLIMSDVMGSDHCPVGLDLVV